MDIKDNNKFYVIRNYTVEHLFLNLDYSFSEYASIDKKNINSYNLLWFYQIPPAFGMEFNINEVNNFKHLLDVIINEVSFKKLILIPLELPENLNIIEEENLNLINAVNDFNSYLLSLQNDMNNIFFFDISEFKLENVKTKFDFKYFILSRAIISPIYTLEFKKWFSKKLASLNESKYKCLVLDLDNTLWSGVIGEDGVNNISFNGGYPGNCFEYFQQFLKNLSKKGIILTVVSKNNLDDIEELWAKRSDMVLEKSDFSELEINWTNKADNILKISKSLNIGIDSMIFIDDSDSEIELVKKFLPEVTTFKFPKDPENVYDLIKELVNLFKRYNITKEDKKRNIYYKQNKLRKNNEIKFKDFNSFIKSLEISITAQKINPESYDRIFQLINKTNQFNLTSIRYNKSEFKDKTLSSEIFCIKVSDKFGDSGITGVALIDIHNDYVNISNFILSCRILGKKIEDDFINFLVNYFKKKNFKKIKANYIASQKNLQTENFYKKSMFKSIESKSGNNLYELDLKNYQPKEYFNSFKYE